MKTVEDFIKKRLEVRGGKIRLKTYQSEILKILEAGLTVKEVHLYLTETYPALQKMNLSNLYEFVRKLKKMPEQNTGFKNPEVGQAEPKKTLAQVVPVRQIENVTTEKIEPPTEATFAQSEPLIVDNRPGRSAFKKKEPSIKERWNQTRKSSDGVPYFPDQTEE